MSSDGESGGGPARGGLTVTSITRGRRQTELAAAVAAAAESLEVASINQPKPGPGVCGSGLGADPGWGDGVGLYGRG